MPPNVCASAAAASAVRGGPARGARRSSRDGGVELDPSATHVPRYFCHLSPRPVSEQSAVLKPLVCVQRTTPFGIQTRLISPRRTTCMKMKKGLSLVVLPAGFTAFRPARPPHGRPKATYSKTTEWKWCTTIRASTSLELREIPNRKGEKQKRHNVTGELGHQNDDEARNRKQQQIECSCIPKLLSYPSAISLRNVLHQPYAPISYSRTILQPA